MLWNRFDAERSRLNLYDHPRWEPGSGIDSQSELLDEIDKLAQSMQGQPHPLIKARAFALVMDRAAIQINPVDWFGFNICGWLTPSKVKLTPGSVRKPLDRLTSRWRREVPTTPAFDAAAKNIAETGAGIFWPDYDHSVPDWDSVMQLGFPGMLERAGRAHKEKRQAGTLTPEQDVFYQAVEIEYEAALRPIGRFIDCAQKHIDEDEKMPLMLQAFRAMLDGTPRTLYELLMLIQLYHMLQQHVDGIQVRSLGNLDADCYPFYLRDVQEGRLDEEKTIELLRYFFESHTNQGHSFGQPFYFGGMDENGNTLINELSMLMLEAYDRSCIVNPKLILKVLPNTPDAFLKKALDMIRRGNSTLVFINEELGMRISRRLGRTEEETRRLVGTGCNNFASRGHETVPEHMYVNLAKGIELALNNGCDVLTGAQIGCETGDVEAMRSFEDFQNAYIRQVECLIGKAFVISDFYDSHLLDYNPAPLYSGAMPDSIRSGRDAYQDGVKYNNTVMFLSCHATAADSLMMIKKHVFDRGQLTLPQLRDILRQNWEGHEALRQQMLLDPDKFGNNRDEVDHLAVSLLSRFTTLVTSRPNVRGGHFVVNGESIWYAHRFGQKCSATPDGRRHGDMLSKNMGASIGQDRSGITALIQSVTKIDAAGFAYGCPFDYVLHPSAVRGEEGLDAMLALLRTFMKRGGYGFQGNVLDASTLRDAQLHPENHRSLQVRVCGWNSYFNDMERPYQDEFIRRAEEA